MPRRKRKRLYDSPYSEKEHWKTFLIKEDQMLNLIEIEKKIKDNNL